MRNVGLDEAQAWIKIARRNISNIIYADDTTLMSGSEAKEPLDESERGKWKSWLKTQHSKNEDDGIQSHHFLANRWGNNGNSEVFYFLGLQNHWDGDCSHEIKWFLLLGRKTMTNLDSILKSRYITLSTKVCLVKAMVFPVVIYGCESWTINKAEGQKNRCFWTVVLEKTPESPWTARKSNQSILKEISPGCSLEGLMLKLKLQYFGHPDDGRDWRQEEKGTTEDEMAGWPHWHDGCESE